MRLSDEELLAVVERYHLGETQEAVLAELDSEEWVSVAELADIVLKSAEGLKPKIRRWARAGLVDLRQVGKGRRYEARLPREWPVSAAPDDTFGCTNPMEEE